MITEEEWTLSTEHPGYKVKVIKRGNATIEIYRPVLEERERKKREQQVQAVAERILSNYYIRKERDKCATQ